MWKENTMRKVLFAGISAFSLAVAFGSTASANPFENANIGGDNSVSNSGVMGDSNKVNNSTHSYSSSVDINNTTNITTTVTADQSLSQENTDSGVFILNFGGKGG